MDCLKILFLYLKCSRGRQKERSTNWSWTSVLCNSSIISISFTVSSKAFTFFKWQHVNYVRFSWELTGIKDKYDVWQVSRWVFFCSLLSAFKFSHWSLLWRDLFPTVNSKLASLFSEDVSIVFGNSGQDPDTLSLTHTHTLIRTPSPSLSSHLWVQMNTSLLGLFIGRAPH